jgi:hypothetical protein
VSRVHIAAIANEEQRNDAQSLVVLMRKVTKQEPRMWGPSIIGFGSYIRRLANVDLKVLEELVARSVADTKSRYPQPMQTPGAAPGTLP